MRIFRTALAAVLILTVGISFAAAATEKRSVKIVGIEGTLLLKLNKNAKWEPGRVGMVLSEGVILKTEAKSEAIINVDGKGEIATLTLRENSQLLLSELLVDKEKAAESTLLDLAVGEIFIKAQKLHGDESRFEVKTPTSIVGVRGTDFKIKVEALSQ